MKPSALIIGLFAGLWVALPAAAQKQTNSPQIEPEARRLINAMSDYLRTSKSFSLEADVLHDDVLPSGQKIMLSSTTRISLRRPSRLRVEHSSDAGERRLWSDGSTLWLLDPKNHTYARDAFTGNTDKVIEHLLKVHHFTPPLADFLLENPATALLKHSLHGFVVGHTHIDHHPATQLAFVDRYVDWQLWIQEAPTPIPLRLVITYKTIQGSPQYIAHFSRWDFTTRLPDSLFEPLIPPGSIELSFLKPQPPHPGPAARR